MFDFFGKSCPANNSEEVNSGLAARPMSEIVITRLQAAEMHMMTCHQVALRAREAAKHARWRRKRVHQRWEDAHADVGLAYADLLDCREELAAKWPEPHGPASDAQLYRYAAALLVNDPDLDEDKALEQARLDDAHYNLYYAADPTVHDAESWPP